MLEQKTSTTTFTCIVELTICSHHRISVKSTITYKSKLRKFYRCEGISWVGMCKRPPPDYTQSINQAQKKQFQQQQKRAAKNNNLAFQFKQFKLRIRTIFV